MGKKSRISPEVQEQCRQACREIYKEHNLKKIRLNFAVDASGCDDWSAGSEGHYICCVISYRNCKRWESWLDFHKNTLHGLIHWTDGTTGSKESRRIYRHRDTRRRLIRSRLKHPFCSNIIISVIDKANSRSKEVEQVEDPIERKYASGLLWYGANAWNMIRSVDNYLSLAITGKTKFLKYPDSHRPKDIMHTDSIAFNNPGIGKLGEDIIGDLMHSSSGVRPTFHAQGHPAIDLADGYAWAFRQIVENSNTAFSPWDLEDPLPRHIRLCYISGKKAEWPETIGELLKLKNDTKKVSFDGAEDAPRRSPQSQD